MPFQCVIEVPDIAGDLDMILKRFQAVIRFRVHMDDVFDLAHTTLRDHTCTKQDLVLGGQIGGDGLDIAAICIPLVLRAALKQVEGKIRFIAGQSE